MKYLSKIFAPTNNRRLNELIGFLLCVSALLLFLALASYSPLDPSLNSASILTDSRAARNWIGVVGALVSDLMLQFFGIGAFLIPVFATGLGIRWFRSRKILRFCRDRYAGCRSLPLKACWAGLSETFSSITSIWLARISFVPPSWQ
ncbi:MAG: hypothetical protein DMG85_10110 [Acidobacteria bacterium]|nr:MAG: hypothetical protein DMG85_10110 [Acidobacteriota bacterium]